MKSCCCFARNHAGDESADTSQPRSGGRCSGIPTTDKGEAESRQESNAAAGSTHGDSGGNPEQMEVQSRIAA